MVQLEAWHVISICISIIIGFFAVFKLLFFQFNKTLDAKFLLVNEQAKQWLQIERTLLEFKAEVARDYVRREDYVLGQTIVESKLDGIALIFQNGQLKLRGKQL